MAGRGTDILLGGNPDVLLEDRLKKYGKTAETLPPEELEKIKAEVKAEIPKSNGRKFWRRAGCIF